MKPVITSKNEGITSDKKCSRDAELRRCCGPCNGPCNTFSFGDEDDDVRFFKFHDANSKHISDPEKLIKVERRNRTKSATRDILTETDDLDSRTDYEKCKCCNEDEDELETVQTKYVKDYDGTIAPRNVIRSSDNHRLKTRLERTNYKPSSKQPPFNRCTVRFNNTEPSFYEYESDVWDRNDFRNYNDNDSIKMEKSGSSPKYKQDKLKRPKSADIKKKVPPNNSCRHQHTCPLYLDCLDKSECCNIRRASIKSSITARRNDHVVSESEDYDCSSSHVSKTKARIKWEKVPSSPYHKNCLKENGTKPRKKKKNRKPLIPNATALQRKANGKRFNNMCYCTKPPKIPIFCSNNSLIRYKKDYEQLGMSKCSNENCEHLPRKKILRNIPYEPESKFLQKFKDDSTEEDLPLQYTKEREALEKAYECLLYDKDHPHCTDYCSHREKHMRGGTDYLYKYNNQHIPSPPCTTPRQVDCNDVTKAQHIRNENFFDTHSTDDLIKNDTKHECLYKYELDERQLPKPTNPDVYGTNRCVFCSKAYTGKNVISTHETFTKRKPMRPSHRTSTTNSQCGSHPDLLPLKLSRDTLESSSFVPTCKSSSSCVLNEKVIVNDHDIVEMELPMSFDKLCQTKTFKFKPAINPQNTFALRYQKGVI